MTLLEKQQFFSLWVSKLIQQALKMGNGVTLGEAFRPDETAEIYALEGRGIKKTLHHDRLAIDLNLFRNGVFLTNVEDYRPLGEWWKAQSQFDLTFVWGGDFDRIDADHFSFLHNGIK
jgi:hypothetical protein